jgi:hypothetical protein
MKILIISLPRSGSTSLMFKIAEETNLKPFYEPFDTQHKRRQPYGDEFIIKTIVNHYPKTVTDPIEWYVNLSKEFDETILLSRKDLIACTESFAYLCHFQKFEGFKPNHNYLWEETPNYEISEFYVNDCNNKINKLSEILNIPVIYYEDIFDGNSEKRHRKGNKETPKKFI